MTPAEIVDETDGRVADFLNAEVGDIGDRDTVLARSLKIDHIHADPIAGDDLALGQGLDQLAVDRRPLHDQRVGVTHHGNQFLRIPRLHPHQVDIEPGVAQDTGFEAVVGIAKIGDDYFECRH